LQSLKKLFDSYDTNKNGLLDYREFIEQIFPNNYGKESEFIITPTDRSPTKKIAGIKVNANEYE
jgi:hypothetical protein